jgi:NADH-quinone oxidoreductase subunit D
MRSRAEISATELLRQSGAVLRIGEAEAERLAEETASSDDETMIINMGPQHPSTHGVLRVMLELRGETVLRTKPVIGYLHTGMEKTAEELTYLQGTTNTTRMDYLSNMHNELVFSLATGDAARHHRRHAASGDRGSACSCASCSASPRTCCSSPPTAWTWPRPTSMIFGIRERDAILRFFEQASGLRMNYNYIRVGGVAADLPDGWEDTVTRLLDELERKLVEHDELFSGQPIWHGRSQGVGVIGPEEAVALAPPGPILRPRACRGTSAGRAAPRLRPGRLRRDRRHPRRHVRPLRRADERDPGVDQDRPPVHRPHAGGGLAHPGPARSTPPPRARIDESMEALIHHFKIFTEGFRVPEGEVLRRRRVARGELGCYLVSDGSAKPVPHAHPGPELREHPDAPAPHARGPRGRRRGRHLVHRPVMGEVDR